MKRFILSVVAVTSVACFALAQDASTSEQTVTIIQAAEAQGPQLAAQPTTVIQSSPLVVSRADQMRKAREQQEVETEQKIVETLEESRLDAEAKRQQEILGSIKAKKEEPKVEAVVAAPVVAPVVQAAPVQQTVEQTPSLSIDDVRNAVREELKADVVEKVRSPVQNYVSGSVGVADYDSVDVQSILSLGMAFGREFDNRWGIELLVGGSNAYVDESAFLYRSMNQFDLGVGTKVNILTGRIRPFVGFDVNYVYRNYSELSDSTNGYQVSGNELNSWAIDYGLIAGINVLASENFSLGLQYKYASNLTYKYDQDIFNTPSYRNSFGYWTPLEERDYSVFGFQIQYLF